MDEIRYNGEERRKNVTRSPITIFVDTIDLDPSVDYTIVTRTSYDLELNERDMKKLLDGLQERLDKSSTFPKNIRIRITGRLVS